MKLDKVISSSNNKTVCRDGGKCIKVFESPYTKADVLNAALNQARIEEAGINIPKVLEITMADGKWAIVSEYIEGKTLAQLMEEEPDRADEYLELFVDLQRDIHSKSCPHLHMLRDKLNRKIGASELSATTRFALHTRLEGMPKNNMICHGDFTPVNIIITEDMSPYILDWSHVVQGNTTADAVKTYLLFRLNGDDALAKKYLDLFCLKSGTSREDILKWLPIVAAAQSVGYEGKERRFLLDMVDASDY